MTYKKRVQKELYEKVEQKARSVGKNADKVIESPGVEAAGSYNKEDVVKVLKDKKALKKFMYQ